MSDLATLERTITSLKVQYATLQTVVVGVSDRLGKIEEWMPQVDATLKLVVQHLQNVQTEQTFDEALMQGGVDSEQATALSRRFVLNVLMALAVGAGLAYGTFLIARGGLP